MKNARLSSGFGVNSSTWPRWATSPKRGNGISDDGPSHRRVLLVALVTSRDIGDDLVDRERARQEALRVRDGDRHLEIPAVRCQSERRRARSDRRAAAPGSRRKSLNSSRMALASAASDSRTTITWLSVRAPCCAARRGVVSICSTTGTTSNTYSAPGDRRSAMARRSRSHRASSPRSSMPGISSARPSSACVSPSRKAARNA